MPQLRKTGEAEVVWADAFLATAPYFKLYTSYCRNYMRALETTRKCRQRDDFASFQAPIDLNLNLTALKYHAGEAAVGAAAGTAVAWVLRRLQGMAMMITVLGSIGTAAALHLHWVSPEQVRAFLSMALSFGRAKVNEATAYVDFDEDGEVTFDDSRIAYSRIAPHIKQHTALTAGVVGGFLTAYGSLR